MPPSGLRYPKGKSPRWKFLSKKVPVYFDIDITCIPLQATTSISATVVVTNSLVLTMPAPTLAMTGITKTANLVLRMPVPQLSITGLVGAIGNLRLTMPMPILVMGEGGRLSLTMPVPVLQMTGLNGAIGNLRLRRLLPSIEMTGYLNEYGILNLTFRPPSLEMTGKESEIGNLILSYRPPKIAMHGFSGVVGSLSLSLRGPSLVMSGFIEARGNLVLTMPVPFLSMTGDQFLAKYFRGLAMNMSHFSVTDYIGYDFNSLAHFNGKFLGGSENGIFSLGGNKDNGLNINASAKMPVLDAYQNILKKARDAWLTCRTDGQMMLVVQLGEEDYYDDIFEPTGKIHEYRVKLPKGIDERFLGFEIRNVDGNDFDLNNLRFTTDAVQGRNR